ncbi:MAG TPA: hypothetical protein VFB63_06235 [Bryobacteraceae bacterium]|nr:hypothetical protein [Bryobacteraceae bacterium]
MKPEWSDRMIAVAKGARQQFYALGDNVENLTLIGWAAINGAARQDLQTPGPRKAHAI